MEGPELPWDFYCSGLGPALVKDNLGAQLCPFHLYPGPATVRSRHCSAQWPASESNSADFSKIISSIAAYLKGDLGRYQSLLRQILLRVVCTCTAICTLWSELNLTVCQPEGQSERWTSQWQSRLSYNRWAHKTHVGHSQSTQLKVIKETALLDPSGHLLYKATYQDWESKQVYLTHRKKDKEAAKMGRQHTPNIRTGEFCRTKRPKLNGGKLFIRYGVQSNSYRGAQKHKKRTNYKKRPIRNEEYRKNKQ